ncbi:MAG: sulfatase-like hydrolase/transferase [Bacilli bacterium]|nr:sulfatase-like hydrolase/transferase [Bacilli bacterium]
MIKKLEKAIKKIINYLKTNILMTTFIVSSLINGCLIRFFTVENYFAIKPILADSVVLLIITAFGYFFKPKHQFKYFLGWSIFFTLICIINAVYYSNYLSFASLSLLKTAGELGGYADAVIKNILEIKQLIYLWQIFALCFVHVQLKKKKYYSRVKDIEVGKIRFLNMSVVSLIVLGFFISMLTGTDISRLNKQWNRSSIVMEFGIYVYQFNDVVSSVRTTVNEMFGYDESYKTFREYYDVKEELGENKYTNLFEGKNVIAIHAESIQGFTMNLAFNGEELTPNINKLAKEGIYFSNFYAQESVGNSSDSEFTSLSSLLPSSSGTVFMNYFNRDYETILKLLKEEKDYYTFSMHGNKGDAWNRNVTYSYLGYDDFYYYTKDYEIDEEIGLGLSDKSFFRQSVEIIKEINNKNENWYGTLVMLTNHTPFSDIEKFDYLVDYKTSEINSETGEKIITPWLEETKIGNYLKSVHYADEAIGELIAMLEEELLENTIIVLYGDHDSKLKQSEFRKLYESEYYESVLINKNDTVGTIDDFTYEINREVPFIIWSPDIVDTKYNKEVKEVMGMIDIMPTLSNMLGVKPKYALGNDMFSIDENIVVFPDGNWITNKIYYNSSKGTFRQLDLETSIDMEYVDNYNKYAENLISLSNGIITYDLIKAYETGQETVLEEKGKVD